MSLRVSGCDPSIVDSGVDRRTVARRKETKPHGIIEIIPALIHVRAADCIRPLDMQQPRRVQRAPTIVMGNPNREMGNTPAINLVHIQTWSFWMAFQRL